MQRLSALFGGRRVYAYYSGRTGMLALALASTVFWAYFGWDGTMEQLWGGSYGIGIHWSTVQTYSLFSYLLMVNVQKGGLSFTSFVDAVKIDLKTNWNEIIYRSWLISEGREVVKARFKKSREESEAHGPVSSLAGYAFAFLMTAAALMFFESLWVPLYDYFAFGNWAWPIYFAKVDQIGPLPFGSFTFGRNVGIAIAGLALAPLCLYGALQTFRDEKGVMQIRRRLAVRWRFDGLFAGLVIITLFAWIYWIASPFQHGIVSQTSLPFSAVLDLNPIPLDLLSSPLIFPSQTHFVQTTYTFYLAQDYMKGYVLSDVYGFYAHNDFVHFINIATKYLTYLTVCYPALVRVRSAI